MNFQSLLFLVAASAFGMVLTHAQFNEVNGTATVTLCDRDPCFNYTEAYPDDCANENSTIVANIVSRDSFCGREWDEWCVVVYNDCYEDRCIRNTPDQQRIDLIAAGAGHTAEDQVKTLCDNALLGTGAISAATNQSGVFVLSLVTIVGVTILSLL